LFADAFTIGVLTDVDGDGVPDVDDFYPNISLDGRLDSDGDGIGDLCQPAGCG
jgi:thrombospondin 2/3/4/5